MTSPVAASPAIATPLFSHDGSRLVFSGRQARDVVDLYVVNVISPRMATRVELPGIPDGASGTYSWATNALWLNWTPYSTTTGAVVADVSGNIPATREVALAHRVSDSA